MHEKVINPWCNYVNMIEYACVHAGQTINTWLRVWEEKPKCKVCTLRPAMAKTKSGSKKWLIERAKGKHARLHCAQKHIIETCCKQNQTSCCKNFICKNGVAKVGHVRGCSEWSSQWTSTSWWTSINHAKFPPLVPSRSSWTSPNGAGVVTASLRSKPRF